MCLAVMCDLFIDRGHKGRGDLIAADGPGSVARIQIYSPACQATDRRALWLGWPSPLGSRPGSLSPLDSQQSQNMDCNFGSDTQPICQLLPALGEAGVRIAMQIMALAFSHGLCHPSDFKWSWMATRSPLGAVILTNYDRSYKEKQTDSHPEPRVTSGCQDAHVIFGCVSAF